MPSKGSTSVCFRRVISLSLLLSPYLHVDRQTVGLFTKINNAFQLWLKCTKKTDCLSLLKNEEVGTDRWDAHLIDETNMPYLKKKVMSRGRGKMD